MLFYKLQLSGMSYTHILFCVGWYVYVFVYDISHSFIPQKQNECPFTSAVKASLT